MQNTCFQKKGADGIVVQLAGMIGAKVIVAAVSSEALNFFGDCGSHVVRVIDLATEDLLEGVLQETGHMGVHCVLDYRHLHTMSEIFTEKPSSQSTSDSTSLVESKTDDLQFDHQHISNHKIIQCLAVRLS